MHTKSMLLLLQLCYFCLCVTLTLKEGDTPAIKCITLSFCFNLCLPIGILNQWIYQSVVRFLGLGP